ncbi:hypothetical protein [Dawidia soli]|uniref:Uncharacterized protein n=1 Tax=Dawidia soli TaxID=2782352 RepID=A0AAP2GDA2_9BACT|nr:hypothetical protein [Dawidia soli]MBT1687154.1 hypothetical protein [Dawidia soli]
MEQDKIALAKRYAKLSNDQLLKMVEDHRDYTPEAFEVLRQEIDNRQIPQKDVTEFKFKTAVNKAILTERSLVPLSPWQKVFYFFAFFIPPYLGIVIGAFGMNSEEDGYTTKARQMRFFRWAGFLSTLIIIVICSQVPLLILILWPASFALAYKFAPKPQAYTEH